MPGASSCGKTPAGRCLRDSLRTDAVGHTRSARHAINSSSAFAGWRANTLLSPRSTIKPGATCREAAQLMHAVSMYQSPDAESGLRRAMLLRARERHGVARASHVDVPEETH